MRRAVSTRIVAVAGLCLGVIAASLILLGAGSSSYRVEAIFENAGQLVKGDEVQTGGISIGSVRSISLTGDRLAKVTLSITDPDHRPLRQGTQAVVRQASLAGVANRYVDLLLPGGHPQAIPNSGTIDRAHTLSVVDLDQLFDTFDPRTRRALSEVIQGQGKIWAGAGRHAARGLLYLNPTIASATRLLDALDGDHRAFSNFVTSTAHAASDLAVRRDDLAGLVDHFSVALRSVDGHRTELDSGLAQLPSVLRSSRNTLVNLRNALGDLQPLVDAAKPAAAELGPFADALASFTHLGRPTFRQLASLIQKPGANNDLIDLLGRLGPLSSAAVHAVNANGEQRQSSFANLAAAMTGLTPQLAFARPYSVDATGWFDDFAHSGIYDALGGTGRIAFHTLSYANVGGFLSYVPPQLRQAVFGQVAQRNQRDRCPGSMERGTAFKPTPDFNCDLNQVPPGP